MTNWRRNYKPGGTYFFTVNTEHRKRWLINLDSRQLLRDTIKCCQNRWPFEIEAIVLLPEHLHAIWKLPVGDSDYPTRWSWIKKEFTKQWLAGGAIEQPTSESRDRNRRRGIWQRRFWEHTIRDENDFVRHMDYIHYNPVKHGLVDRPRDWPWSSFHRHVNNNNYPIDWCCPDISSTPLVFDDIADTVGE